MAFPRSGVRVCEVRAGIAQLPRQRINLGVKKRKEEPLRHKEGGGHKHRKPAA